MTRDGDLTLRDRSPRAVRKLLHAPMRGRVARLSGVDSCACQQRWMTRRGRSESEQATRCLTANWQPRAQKGKFSSPQAPDEAGASSAATACVDSLWAAPASVVERAAVREAVAFGEGEGRLHSTSACSSTNGQLSIKYKV